MMNTFRTNWTGTIGAGLAVAALLAGCGGGGGGGGENKKLGGGGSGSGASTAPNALVATSAGQAAINLAWADNSAAEDGFRIERKTGLSGSFAVIAQVAKDVTVYADTGLQPSTPYTYRVTAFAGGADLGTSNEASATTASAPAACTEWSERSGTALEDRARGTAYDPATGITYVVGQTKGAIGTQSFGGNDGYLRAYDSSGAVLWSQQIGTPSEDMAIAVAVDGAGSIYVAGFSDGLIAGSSSGGFDVFAHKYPRGGGAPQWVGHYGTARDDRVSAIAIDSQGRVAIGGTSSNIGVGNEQDPFMAQFDPAAQGAAPRWTWLSGNGFFNENLTDLAIDPRTDDICCIGRTQVVMPNVIGTPPNGSNYWAVGDIYVARVDASGVEQWIVQVGSGCGGGSSQGGTGVAGTGGDIPGGVAIDDAGDVYVTGFAQGEADGPGSYLGPAPNTQRPASQLCNAQDWTVWGDAVLFKLDDAGTLQWTKQFGSVESDWATDVTIAGGKVFVAGVTQGDVSMTSAGNKGGIDMFVAAFSTTGTFEWIRQSGTADDEWAYSMTTDGAKAIFVVGGVGPSGTPDAWDPFVKRVCD